MTIKTPDKKTRGAYKIRSPLKQKALLLLASGVALGLTNSPKQYSRIIKAAAREWRWIDKNYLYQIITGFKRERLVNYREEADGTIIIVLTESGRKKVVEFNIDKITLGRPTKWDGKWRLLFFDIPEKYRRARDALREKLKGLGLHELQKSVFVYPFPCFDELNSIIEFFEIRNYVRLAEAVNLTGEAELILKFKLK